MQASDYIALGSLIVAVFALVVAWLTWRTTKNDNAALRKLATDANTLATAANTIAGQAKDSAKSDNAELRKLAADANAIAAEAKSLASTANEIANQANKFASAGSETAVLQAINEGRKHHNEVTLKIAEARAGKTPSALNADERRYLLELQHSLDNAVEILLNAYELACGMYRDKKLDADRFFKHYNREIREICESKIEIYTKRMLPAETSHYEAIWAVYREWHRREDK